MEGEIIEVLRILHTTNVQRSQSTIERCQAFTSKGRENKAINN